MLCRRSQRSETQYRTPTKIIKSAYPYGKTNDHEDKSHQLPIAEPVEIDSTVTTVCKLKVMASPYREQSGTEREADSNAINSTIDGLVIKLGNNLL